MARPNNTAALQGHIAGLREAKAAFQALPEITRDAMLGATEITLREIERHAKAKLASSPSIQTRNLYNAVGWTLNRKSGRGRAGIQNVTTRINGKRVKGIVTAGRDGSAATSAGASIDRPARRAHFIEFGTRHHPAEPFMGPAADSQKAAHVDRCHHAGKVIERQTAAIGLAGGGRTL